MTDADLQALDELLMRERAAGCHAVYVDTPEFDAWVAARNAKVQHEPDFPFMRYVEVWTAKGRIDLVEEA